MILKLTLLVLVTGRIECYDIGAQNYLVFLILFTES